MKSICYEGNPDWKFKSEKNLEISIYSRGYDDSRLENTTILKYKYFETRALRAAWLTPLTRVSYSRAQLNKKETD